MAGDYENVVLSEAELERLAAIEEALAHSDPALVQRLGRHQRMSRPGRIWLAALLVGVGFIVLVGSFTRWLWVAVAGLALMTGGALMSARPLVARVWAEIDRRSRFPGRSAETKR